MKNFRQMVLVFFLDRKQERDSIYKITVNFSLSFDMKPGTGNPNRGGKISVVSVGTGKR